MIPALLRRILAAFFILGVDPDATVDPNALATDPAEQTPSPDPAPDPAPDPDPDDDNDIDSLIARASAPQALSESPEAKAARERRRELEEAADAAARRALEARATPIPSDPYAEADARELAEARARGASERELADIEWAQKTSRTLRASDQKASYALYQAAELNDKAEFRELSVTKPKLYAAYKDRVEEELGKLRRGGSSVPRITMLDYLIGKDIREGKIKTKAKAAKPAELPANVTRIDRGRSPVAARSDVAAKGRNARTNSAEKRLMNNDGSFKRI
jgi:hypothetical protein